MARSGRKEAPQASEHEDAATEGAGRKRSRKAAPGRGDNSTSDLERYIDRLCGIQETINAERESFNSVLAEAMEHGLHKKALRAIVKRRLETAEEAQTRIETEQALDDYLARLGMLADTPLGQAAASSKFPGTATDAPPI